jgi:drug/metabolite transporter (DMT)-like permease
MRWRERGVNLSRSWPFWGLHFGLHIILGLVAAIAGVVVIFRTGELLNGLALVGAGSFALINGWQGLNDLGKSNVNKLYRTLR